MMTLYERVSYYGIHSGLALALPVALALKLPRRHPRVFQGVMLLCVWWPGWSESIELHVCGFFEYGGVAEPANCAGKDFLNAIFCASSVLSPC